MLLAVLKGSTMSDDIDIEEHDVLDNPNIRRLFPDLSIIKKEIYQYEEGLNNVEETVQEGDDHGELHEEAAEINNETDLPTTSEIKANTDETLTSKQLEVRRRFKLFLDSLVDDCIENSENNSDTNSDVFNDIVTSNSPKPLQTEKTRRKTVKPIRNNNIVILGSKPNAERDTKKADKVKKRLKIVLKNVSPYLNACKRYCKDCFILFPNIKKFKYHMDNVHSIKKSTDTIKPKKLKKCEICNIEMLKNNLPRHYKRVHAISEPDNLVGDMNRSLRGRTKVNETNTLTSEQTKAKSINSYNCFHCQHLFETRSTLIEHLYEVLNPYKMISKDSKNESTTKKPAIMTDKQSDDEKIISSKKIKRKSALLQSSSVKNTNNKNKLTKNGSQKTSLKENKQGLNKNKLSSSRHNLRKTIKRNPIERDESIENNGSLSDRNMDSQSCDKLMCDSDQKTSSTNSSYIVMSKKIKRKSAITQGSSDKISNNKNKLTKNGSQKTSTEENKQMLNKKKQLSSSRNNHKKTNKHNSIERHESIENYDSLSDHNMDSQSSDEFMSDSDQKASSTNSSHIITSKKIKRMSALTQGSSDKISNKKSKLTENDSQKTSAEENIQGLKGNRLRPSRDNLKKTIKRNFIKKDEYIENNDSPSNHNMDNQSSDEFMYDSDQKTIDVSSSHSVDTPKKEAYQCFICSQYMTYISPYHRHMGVHNITKDFIVTRDIGKTTFDGQCHFCSKKQAYIKTYNNHVYRNHREKYIKKVYLDQKAFQSVIFKCFKCDVFFLSANAAMSHSEHDEIFVDWKCTKCNELFKITDKSLHLKQHKLSKKITTYVLSESALNRILYKCLKCTVHFSEKEYFLHNACDLEIPSSAYCKTCDILIYTNDMEFHESDHKKKNLQLIDFPLIETDIITNKVKKCTDEKTNPYAQLPLAITFCTNCKCFLNNLSRTRPVHLSGECATVILPRMCGKCGLVFTASGFKTHKMLHDKIKKINMQSFYFYDMKTNEQIAPPTPRQPNCNICGVHFISRAASVGHECSKQSFTICNICNIKFTQAAYKLHMNYHKYKLSSSILNKIDSTKKRKVEEAKEVVSVAVNTSVVEQVSLEKQISVHADKDNVKEIQKFLYTCIPCNMTLGSYDKVIQHCHEHYDYTKIHSEYKKMHDHDKSEFDVQVKFDPFYFRFSQNVWVEHIFENLTKVQIDNVLKDSMYKFEHRIQMEEIQLGPNDMALYKCDMCRSFIDHDELFFHASNSCSIMSKKYPCLSCGLCFDTEKYRTIHEKDHDRPHITASSYRLILFNKIEHQNFNKMYDPHKFILYQCRNCEAVVDKLQCNMHICNGEELMKCATCGLLFYNNEFNSHVNKHEKIKYFQSDQMVIIMFGKLKSHTINKQIKSPFSGTIYDLSFYRCTNCGLCLETENDKSNHVCVPKSYITQCHKCYLYFKKKEMLEHLKFHENNLMLGYDDFNSNIISFSNDEIKIEEASTSYNEKEEDEKSDNIDEVSTQTIYKCSCGLHFLEKPNAIKHHNNCSNKMKIAKQSCIKCDLLFTPGELFDHLLKHHGNKKLQYKYDIINISEPQADLH